MNPAENGMSASSGKYSGKAFFLLSFLAGSAFAQPVAIQTASVSPAQTQTAAGAGTQDLHEIRVIAEQFLTEKTKDLTGKAEIAITPLDARLKLPACPNPIAYLSQGARIWGKTTVAIRCEAPEAWRIMVKAHVRIHAPYLSAARALPQGHVIAENDITSTSGDITAMRPGILTDKKDVVGRTLARTMQPGTPIRAEQLRATSVIQQGQAVRVISKGAGFSVSGEGHAINSANEGQVAKAKMPNGSIIRGIAKADGIIEINF